MFWGAIRSIGFNKYFLTNNELTMEPLKTYVFINIAYKRRIKMIEEVSLAKAILSLTERLSKEPKSGDASDYVFGYNI